jgi:glucosylglycerate synthase
MASTGSNSSVQEPDAAAGSADVVVALTSYNDAGTVGAVARAVREGLARYYRETSARIVIADAGSTDGTLGAARDAVEPGSLLEVQFDRGAKFGELPYHGQPGRVLALRGILQAARSLGAKACAVVDASIQTVEPSWVQRLLAPVLADGFDYVSPYYPRHVHEGAITKGIVYPLFRTLYGVRMRQPAASEFGCSGRLVAHYLEQEFWEVEHASAGIDLWLSAAAVCGEFRTCEAILGARAAAARGPADLSTTLAQVVGALLADTENRVDVWQRVRGSVGIPVFGAPPSTIPDAPALNVESLLESFRLGYRELREIWTWVLPPRTIVELRKLTEAAPDRFRFDDRLWASIVYDFALGYGLRVMPRDHLLRSLTPLYAGWLSSFVLELGDATLAQTEDRVERICLGFESEKRYLISRWRWPERLR